MKKILILGLALLGHARCDAQEVKTAPATPAARTAAQARVGDTRVARWQDDKKAAFLLMFDDGWPSHWQVALPEMKKRALIGTFYIVPKKGEYQKFEATWLSEMLEAGMVLGNHTTTHDGFQGRADAEMEIGDCTKYLHEKIKGKTPRLISFALPGVKDYDYGDTTLKDLLAKDHLIDRPDFKGHGATYHLKTTEEFLALADKAIADGGLEYLVFHGLERITPDWGYQDFWAVKQDIFLPLLDGLQARRDRGDLWITDHISAHQYETERSSARAQVLEATAKKIRVQLGCDADPQLYDLPLTLQTRVPASWSRCVVTQGEARTVATPKSGLLLYKAAPGKEVVSIERAP